MNRCHRRVALLLGMMILGASAITACGSAAAPRPFTIGAIPDQDPQKLQRLYGDVANTLSTQLHMSVRYRAVTDYTAAVGLFRSGDLDMVWFGGLTGVQARLQVPGAQAIAQRDIDETFQSVFIVNTSTPIQPFDTVAGLGRIKGLRFTFGSESSTSGRLMPEYFLKQAGVGQGDLAGKPGFSGSHDKTIQLVESGSFQAGALNRQVWMSRLADHSVDLTRVREVFRTPAYHDYHWLIRPDLTDRYGSDIVARATAALIGLNPADPASRRVLGLFGAHRFIPSHNGNYQQIEEIGRSLGLIH